MDGAALLDAIGATVRRYVVLGGPERDAVALWALAVHVFDAFSVFPRAFVTAPEKGCGKTTLLDVIGRLVPRALPASNITAAALFRVIETARPTLLLDEADTFVRDNEDLRGVLDAGHRRDSAVIRTVGDDHEPRQFSAWAPVALAAIGHLPGTIEDRAVIIRLQRRRPDEAVDSLRQDRAGVLDELARQAARWAADHLAALAVADPEMPASLYNRAADNWRPLLTVADAAGGEWPMRARQAAAMLTSGGEDAGSIRVALLADIKAAFAQNADRLSSEDLVSCLAALDDRPWPEFKAGKPITKAQLARLLKPLGIASGTIRLDEERTAKGYKLEGFGDAFARYLPPDQNVTPSQPAEILASGEISKRHNGVGNEGSLRFEKPENSSVSAACDVVTFCDSENLPNGDARGAPWEVEL